LYLSPFFRHFPTLYPTSSVPLPERAGTARELSKKSVLVVTSRQIINPVSLYHQTNRLVQETQHCFEKLEKAGYTNSDTTETEIQARIDSITSNCEKLDILIYKEQANKWETSN
jgi:hypothetical protein